MRLLFRVSTAKWETKAPPQRGGALRAPPLWHFDVFYLAVETRNKTTNGNLFFIKVWPNFWPQIDNRLWVVPALNKKKTS